MQTKPYINQKSVSTLGFGAWPLGNTAHGKTMTQEEGIALVKTAYENGINFFDTAPNYANGMSETIIGKALEEVREKVVINTKFGHHANGDIDFSIEALEPAIHSSLKRLKTNYLDSLILHNAPIEILSGETAHFDVLNRFKKEGLIQGMGVSVDTKEELDIVLKRDDIDVIELLFNIFAQSTREYFKIIKEKNIKLIIKVPLDSGWLTEKYTKTSTFTDIKSRWSETDKIRRDTLVKKLRFMVGSQDPLTRYALGFIWSYDAVTTVIPGIRTLSQLHDHLASWHYPFPKTLKPKLEAFYDKTLKDNPLPW